MTRLRCPSNTVRYLRQFNGSQLPMVATGGEHPFTLSYLTPAYFQMYPTGTGNVGGRTVETLPGSEPATLTRGFAADRPDRHARIEENLRIQEERTLLRPGVRRV